MQCVRVHRRALEMHWKSTEFNTQGHTLTHTHNGGSISSLPLTIKISQDPHHHACPIKQVIQLHDILDLVSLICRMWDLNGYDGSIMGHQREYTIEQLPAEYQFLDMWDYF